MAVLIDRYNEGNFSDNIVNPALSFNSGTWTVASGSGTALLNVDNYVEGVSSLRIQNNVPANAITVTNSDQTTTIPTTGNYKISWFAKKNIDLEVRELDVLIYQNAVLLDTQTCILGSTDVDEDVNNLWQRFQSSQSYSFTKGDAITFQFRIKGATTTELNTFVYVDALMISLADRNANLVPSYVKPLGEKVQTYGIYDYNDSATSVTPISVSASAWTPLTNDALGAFTNKTYSLSGVSDVYDASSNLFDFRGLELGDKVEIRFNGIIITSGASQTFKLRIKAAIGTGSEYEVPFIAPNEFKTAGIHDVPSIGFITMLNTDTLNNGARFEIFTDDTADFKVIGWQCIVYKRLV